MEKGSLAWQGPSTEAVERAAYIRRECGRVDDVGPVTKSIIFRAVSDCVRYWPNAHLGSVPPREDIATAFRIIRRAVAHGKTLRQAAVHLSDDAMRHVDM